MKTKNEMIKKNERLLVMKIRKQQKRQKIRKITHPGIDKPRRKKIQEPKTKRN